MKFWALFAGDLVLQDFGRERHFWLLLHWDLQWVQVSFNQITTVWLVYCIADD